MNATLTKIEMVRTPILTKTGKIKVSYGIQQFDMKPVEVQKECEVEIIECEGYKFYIDPNEATFTNGCKMMYGIETCKRMFGIYLIGRTGEVERKCHVEYDPEKHCIRKYPSGYHGATMKGWGTRILRIE